MYSAKRHDHTTEPNSSGDNMRKSLLQTTAERQSQHNLSTVLPVWQELSLPQRHLDTGPYPLLLYVSKPCCSAIMNSL